MALCVPILKCVVMGEGGDRHGMSKLGTHAGATALGGNPVLPHRPLLVL